MSEALHAENGDIEALCSSGKEMLTKAGFKVDYLEIRCAADLSPAVQTCAESLVILAAAYLGKPRLIDNLQVDRYQI